ncbi:MAG: hypothetical protein P8J32_00640 [bacterium]|jgi:hypothetical protein|nr:hypothetical protein [bacterium]
MNIEWKQVLKGWREAEEAHWTNFAKERGYDSWWEWRKSYVTDLGLEERAWTEEVLDDPHSYVKQLHIGGYRGWKKYRPANVDTATFEQVATSPTEGELSYAGEERVDVRVNGRVQEFVRKLHDTTILVLRSGDIEVLLDGHHRCAAIAIEGQDGTKSEFNLTVQICQFANGELELLKTFAQDREIIVKKQHD